MDADDIARLSGNKRQLLEALLKKRINADSAGPSMPHQEMNQAQNRAYDPGELGRAAARYAEHESHHESNLESNRESTEERSEFGQTDAKPPPDSAQHHQQHEQQQRQPPSAGSSGEWLRDALFSSPLLQRARALLEAASDPQQAPSNASQIQESPLICMQAEGNKIPFFCVHALLGSTFHYFALANLLDQDQPFYALQAPGLDGVQPPLNRISEFAACYIHYIREVQPKGPYKIGGYSFGGLVAFEIARQLTLAGETVSHLIIFGTDVPIAVSNPKLFKCFEFFSQYYADFYNNLVKPFFSYEKRLNLSESAKKLPFSPVLVKVAVAHCLAAFRYNPSPFSGRITLFETLEQQMMNPADPSRGWDRLACAGVETQLVSGNHLSMLDKPHIDDLAEKLNWCLRSV